jgi:hypothetical protein
MVEVQVARRPEGYVLVRVAGEIDLGARLPTVQTLSADGDTAPVVLDLCGARFFSLAGVDWVDATVTALTARRRAVRVVCAAPGPVWRLVGLLDLQRRWPVYHQVDDAVADLDGTS